MPGSLDRPGVGVHNLMHRVAAPKLVGPGFSADAYLRRGKRGRSPFPKGYSKPTLLNRMTLAGVRSKRNRIIFRRPVSNPSRPANTESGMEIV